MWSAPDSPFASAFGDLGNPGQDQPQDASQAQREQLPRESLATTLEEESQEAITEGASSPEVTTMAEFDVWSDDDSTEVLVPTYGGVYKESDSVFIAWSGTDPDAEVKCYSYDQKEKKWIYPRVHGSDGWQRIRGPLHVEQFRPTGVKEERKTKAACTTYSGDKFDGIKVKDGETPVNVKTYKDMLRTHIIKHGMWDIFNAPDPLDPTIKRDIFREHGHFPLSEVTDYVKELKRKADIFIIQNLEMSGDYIRATLSSNMLSKVVGEVPSNASGPETLVALMIVVFSDSYEAMQKCKNELKALTLRNYSNENVKECCDRIMVLSERLDSAGYFDQDLLCSIAHIFESTTDERFKLWAIYNYNQCSKFVKSLRTRPITSIPKDDRITYETLVKDAKEEHRKLVDSERWSPAGGSGSKEEPTLPKSYKAAIKSSVTEALKQGGFQPKQKSGNSSGGGESSGSGGGDSGNGNERNNRFKGKCDYCGKDGHKKKNCRKLKADQKNGTVNGNSDDGDDKPWYLVRGDPSKTTMERRGRTYKWCKKCKAWRFHDGSGHDAWAARQRDRPTTAAAAMATNGNGANEEADDDDFISFGGGLCREANE